MICVVARFVAAEAARKDLASAFAEIRPTVLREKGCKAYEIMLDVQTEIKRQAPLEPDVVTLLEQWESLEDLYVHSAAPHMAAFREKNGHLIRSVDLRICQFS